MAEVLTKFDTVVSDDNDRLYVPRACGRKTVGKMWEGWIEFDPQEGGPVLRTPRESTQPNREDLDYWASGLTVAYLEGALERALHPPKVPDRRGADSLPPRYDRPAHSRDQAEGAASSHKTRFRPVLDPFEAYGHGEDRLREELGALNEGHLRKIVRYHDLVGKDEVDLQALQREALAELIVAAVRKRAG